jgi:hypothetical protein
MSDDLHDGLPPVLNIDNMANGAVYELLGRELARVAENISDPNTSETAKRTITIKIVAEPFNDRSGASYSVAIDSRLAGTRPAEGTMYIVRRNNQFLVVGRNNKQDELQFDMKSTEPTTVRPS